MTDKTILHGDHFSAHRSLSIKKCENGYQVDAVFQRPKAKFDDFERSDRKRFVFYTEAELLDFVKQYLAAPASELRGEK